MKITTTLWRARARVAERALYVVGALGFVVQCALVLANPFKYQWDFRSYFYAAKLVVLGENPYDFDVLRRLGSGEVLHDDNLHPFLYPVHALAWFLPLGGLGYQTAYYLYFALKLVALFVFMRLSARWVEQPLWRFLMPLFGLLMFNGAVAADLRSGNVALFESTLVLGAFEALMQKRTARFGALVLLANSFKMVLSPLLIAPVFTRAPRAIRSVLLPLAIVPLPLALCALLLPELTGESFAAMRGFTQSLEPSALRGALNASSARLLSDIVFVASGAAHTRLVLASYACLTALVALCALRALARMSHRSEPRAVLAYLLLAYGLLVPRLTMYSYTLMFVPCLFVLSRMSNRVLQATLTLFGCVPFFYVARDVLHADPTLPARSLALLPFEYSCLFLIAACWIERTYQELKLEHRIATTAVHAAPASRPSVMPE